MASLSGELLSSRAEMHSAQDGILVPILVWLPVINFDAAIVLYGVLGASVALSNGSVKLKALVNYLNDNVLRLDQIRNNPEYFAIPFVIVSALMLGPAYMLGLVDPSVLVP